MMQLLIVICAFVGAATLAGGIALMFRTGGDEELESRLSSLTSNGGVGSRQGMESANILASSLDEVGNPLEDFVSKFLNLRNFIEQAGMTVEPAKLVMLSLGLGFGGAVLYALFLPMKAVSLLVFVTLALIPLGVVWFKRGKRLKKFGAQLVEALELISRALRAGHSLPAGIQLVAQQMEEPIAAEFGRCYEEQNLGIPLEEALEEVTRRVPNVDLRFFVTAIILQRQTGGDLAEILDKIGRLIRERFQIFGQIAALTGEGRLSGIVLLALPPILFGVMLKINYDYIMTLFSDPLGQKMLVGAIVLQVIGALVIKKIISIKV